MKIHYGDFKKEIKNIILAKSKFQKVMLLYDENTSIYEINEIYEEIKDICIFNKSKIYVLKEEEISNGYRLIIYLMRADNYLKYTFKNADFINIFCVAGNEILPYLLNEKMQINKSNTHLIMPQSKLDLNMISSLYFNSFFNYFHNLITGQDLTNLPVNNLEITPQNTFDLIEKSDMFYADLDVVKNQNLEYGDLILLDYVLLNAFTLLINAIKEQNYMLVDVYKAGKDDVKFIEKCYKLKNNETLFNIIILNYNCLQAICAKTKEKVKELLSFVEINNSKITNIIEQLKQYSKQDAGLMGYFYLCDFFEV